MSEFQGMLSDSDDTIERIGTDEALECWYDLVNDDKLNFYDSPVFTESETTLIRELHRLIEISCNSVPSTWKPVDVAFCEPWRNIVAKANDVFILFQERGLLDEELEITRL